MKLIIDMPEEAYEYVKATSDLGWLTSPEYADIIKNGMPLNDMLDKLKTEIEESRYLRYGQPSRKMVVDEYLDMIDKYKV